jgi:nicotinate phosphoribosyltransferase
VSFRVKTSEGKRTIPGAKQIYRKYSGNGEIEADILALQSEDADAEGEPLLINVLKNGKVIYSTPNISQIREKTLNGVAKLPVRYRELANPQPAPVRLSSKLQTLSEALWKNPEKQ